MRCRGKVSVCSWVRVRVLRPSEKIHLASLAPSLDSPSIGPLARRIHCLAWCSFTLLSDSLCTAGRTY